MDHALRDEAVQLLQDLLRIDTTNPPGRETAAATFLQGMLAREGIACELVAKEPDRANLIARLPGTGDGPSLCIFGHTDVVYADAADWTHPPFDGVVDGDHVWGRGAIDMKNHTAANVLALLRLKRSGFQPRGDIVLIAEADEEDGVDRVGLPFIVEQRPDVRTDYALTEGGGERLVLADGRVAYFCCVAEKATMPTRVSVTGRAGHASMPESGDNALTRLAPVIERLSAYRPVTRRTPELDALLDQLVPGNGDLSGRLDAGRALHPMLHHLLGALSGSTFAATMAQASRKRNVIPAHASVTVDCRTLPGTTWDELWDEFGTALDGVEHDLEQVEPEEGGSRSPLSSPLWDATEAFIAAEEPGALLLPSMCVGFTNSHFLRDAFGTVSYGFLPLRHTSPEIVDETVHAPDERIHVDDMELAVRYIEHVCRTIGSQT